MVDPYRVGTRDYMPVIQFSDDGVLVGDGSASACAVSSVGDSATSVALAAALSTRKSVRIVNDSTAILYVCCEETASATNYTARLEQYEAVTINGFTGAINGIWASDAGGNARVSEFS